MATDTKDVYYGDVVDHEVVPTRDWTPEEEKKAKRK